ncbi:aromatic ring-hydroxylating oxygenase subunit alpha [Ilumatobacter coccineus]|uniref:Putative iron-sulfur protein n=1 Tax=Ilumatobacter coccineus (strain NBRC 103263 / KCTC 29153 / YM16-304) TaxID=1313172 RepID=A0A6C7EF45_ILUCY|nr:aromatic ring-hydroxylating dioxygenase subunit alpha [Ilumatobacter coccineus]BAN04542.1 putative iron-sulfur protein [Ilumatobacter coccineus YM16-304]
MTNFVHSEALRTAWYPVARIDDIGEQPFAVRLLGDDLVIWRGPTGDLIVAPDRCPHREAPLSIGKVSNGELACAYHGWGFGADGKCVSVPSSGPDAAIPPTAHLPCMQVQQKYGLVWVCPGEPAADIPTIAQDDDPAFRRLNTEVEPWATSAPRMVDNFLDISHFPWVHTGTFGSAQDPDVPKLDLKQLDDDFYGYAYDVDAANPDEGAASSGSTDAIVHRSMSTGFFLPLIVRSTIRYDDGLEHILLLCSTPIDDLNTLFTFVVWRNDDHSIDPEEILQFDRAIGAEDKAMLERVPGTLPLSRTGVVNVQSDKPSVEWRRRFAELTGLG